ncbi:Uncharacterized protein FWK35_00006671 [Aphis craccivora]|uniref:HAT C-terminal dimerisation domain-containing protein n=1 Tax=Aphis craccivora TaxID=307492 RepID=A0A6G0YT22_APHCR|nr:Uncharacterized protein FWK35_00006671 [Aphis craccivora]
MISKTTRLCYLLSFIKIYIRYFQSRGGVTHRATETFPLGLDCLVSNAYSLLTLAYKYLLTFPVTQVSCEKSFFTLKYLKNRLRNSMTNDNLEAFMLISIEKSILMELDNDIIINELGTKRHAKNCKTYNIIKVYRLILKKWPENIGLPGKNFGATVAGHLFKSVIGDPRATLYGLQIQFIINVWPMKLYFLALDTKKATDPWFKALLNNKQQFLHTVFTINNFVVVNYSYSIIPTFSKLSKLVVNF